MEPLPAVGVIVPPPGEPVRPLGVATIRPAGRVSVKPTPESEEPELGLVMVKLRVEVLPCAMVVGLNDLPMVGGATTSRFADAVSPLPPSVEVTALVTLFFVPAV